MKIGHREIGNGQPCMVVAEVGMAHEGSIGQAHAYIDAIAKAGADAVKFQLHMATDGGTWRVKPRWSPDETRSDYWARTAFSRAQWYELAGHAGEVGLVFLCSPFSVLAAEILEPIVPAWKVASGQVTNGPLLDYMAAHPRPTIISGGMATDAEVTEAAMRFSQVVLLGCTSVYPTPLHQVGLTERRTVDIEYGTEALQGVSDHSGTIWPSVAAAAGRLAMVEIHVTMSRDAYGPDTASSITLADLGTLCEGVKAIHQAMQPVDREALLKGPLLEMRRHYMGVSA